MDAVALAGWVRGNGDILCPQHGSKPCTTVSQWGTAGVGICSRPKTYSLNCFTVGSIASFIASDCVRTVGGVPRVGGKFIFDYAPEYDSVINLFRSGYS